MPDSRPLRPGDPERLGDYRLIGILGEGGQGIVYLGEHLDETGESDSEPNSAAQPDEPQPGEPGGLFAVKLLRTHLSSDPKARRYFAKEVAAAQRIDPSYTARIIEADMEGRTPYIVSEYVEGRPLSEAVRANGPMPAPELHRLAVGTLNALVAIHQVNVVHRDFKPSNVLLNADRPRVIDFGIARALDSTISVSSGVVGTPAYMAPEQLTGQQITPAVDVFAWGATMTYAATGAPPFGQDSIPVVMHRLLNVDPVIGDLQGPLRELVWYCLYKNPAQRPTAQQVLARLNGALAGYGAAAHGAAAHGAVAGSGWSTPAAAPPLGPGPFGRPSAGLVGQPSAVPGGPPGQPAGMPVWGTDPNARGADPNMRTPQPGHLNAPVPSHQLPPNQPAPHTHPAWGPVQNPATTRPPGKARRPWLPVAAAAAGVALVAGVTVVAVQLAKPDDPPVNDRTSTPVADAALTKVVNPSSVKGGTLKLVHSSDFDSLDPGDTYLSTTWNFSRLYARPLLTYKSAPGAEGLRLTPDLASGPGQPSQDLKTWTYKVRSGLKYEDGTPVTAKDVRYAVARTFATDVLFLGPRYFQDLLDAGDYAGPYKDKDLNKFTGVTAPDDQTVVFHLKKAYADFDYLAALPQTAPVPQAKDTGAEYKKHPVSTGPYKVDSYLPGKSVELTRNPNWSDDGIRKQLPDRIQVTLSVNGDGIDQQLLGGQADLDASGLGLQQAARPRVLGDASLKRNTDNLTTGFLRYIALSSKVAPFDNVHCRRAVQYAVNRTATQTALGGSQAAEIATNMLPPAIVGRQRFDLYPEGQAKAKEELASCGRPSGFTTRVAIRADRPKDRLVAEALTQALNRVGIKLETKQYPVSRFYSDYAGKPEYVRKNGLGVIVSVWGPDYPTGLGFFPLLVDGRHIPRTGNSNFAELNDTEINGLLDRAAQTRDQATREGLTAELDRKVMDRAVIVPLAYDKSLLYRGARLRNVYVNQMLGGYDYAALGLK